MTHLYLIRHGETDYNREGRFQGQSDIPLNETGHRQKAALGLRLAQTPFEAIYASDLSRATATAAAFAAGRTIIEDRRLREVDVGRAVHLTGPEIEAREPAFAAARRADPDGVPFPDGENAYAVQARALEALAEISAKYSDGQVAVVTHGGLIKMVVAYVLGIPLSARDRFAIDNCGLTVVEWSESRKRIRTLNETGYLQEAPCAVRAEL